MSDKDIHALMDDVVQHPTIDKFLDRHPKTLVWPDDYEQLVHNLRRERALFIEAGEAKAQKKAEKENE